ncbi:MAG: chromosome partitioning protein ParB, partial [Clostridia bacterium]|nr:chromosome partitioning protein ParB [Clostridia bacterium]
QRESLSPMEKAKAYKMKLEAIKHQGTSRQVVGKSEESADTISKTDSGRTVQRLIRLTYLVPELQEYVDTGKMKVSPAVEISFLDEELQRDIVDRIEESNCEVFPSHAQARRMRQLDIEGKLDYESIKEIMSELKPNQVEKLKIPMDDIRQYVPREYTPKDIEELAVKLFRQNHERECRYRDDDAR